MRKEINKILDALIAFFTRRRLLYRIIGWAAFISLITELGILALPYEVLPDYQIIEEQYGYFPSLLLGFLISKYAGGYTYLSVGIKTIVVLFSLYIDYKVQMAVKNKKSVWNIFIGSQHINQTFNFKDEE